MSISKLSLAINATLIVIILLICYDYCLARLPCSLLPLYIICCQILAIRYLHRKFLGFFFAFSWHISLGESFFIPIEIAKLVTTSAQVPFFVLK